jgi:hypothetical protein
MIKMNPEERKLRRRAVSRFVYRDPLTHEALARATGMTKGQVSYWFSEQGVSTAALRRGDDPKIDRLIRRQRKQLAKMIQKCDQLRRSTLR